MRADDSKATDGVRATGVDETEPKMARTPEGDLAWIEAQPPGGASEAEPPLLLVHGFTGHRDDFVGVLDPLANLGGGRRVLTYDLRGHGDSVGTSGSLGWSFEQHMKDLLALLDHLEIEQVDLVGHSMGGFVAQRFVLAHAERVRSLILLCTGPEVPSTLVRENFLKAASIADARGMDGLQELFEKSGRLDPSPSVAGWGERYWHHQRRRFGAMTPTSYREIGLAFFDSPSMVPRLREIDLPTSVLVGESDRDWLPGSDLFEQNLPAARRQTLVNSEHHPHNENTVDFLAAVEEHLARLEPTAAASGGSGAG